MNKESYKTACKFVMESATSFIEKGKKEFGEKKLDGGWFVFRVQILPTLNIQELIRSIPETVFKKVGAAYNYDNLYFFPLFEEMEIVFQTLQKLNHEYIEAAGVGWFERFEKEFMICNLTMIGNNRQAATGLVQINCLELKWLSDPIFTIQKSND